MNDDIIKAVCAAVVLGEGENYEPVHLEPREARQAIAAYHAAIAARPVQEPVAWVADYQKTDGTTDFYVMIGKGDSAMSLHMHRIRGRAEYEAAEINHALTGGPKPEFSDFDLDTSPAAPQPAPQVNVVATGSSWQWWAGSNEEWCTVGPEGSREAIIQAATNDSLGECDDDGGWKLVFHIVEARQDDLRLAEWIESDRLLERAEESIADSDRTSSEWDDGPWFQCSPEQEKDLEERVRAACDQWQTAHGLKFSCSTFSATRNKEIIVVDTAIEPLAASEGSTDEV